MATRPRRRTREESGEDKPQVKKPRTRRLPHGINTYDFHSLDPEPGGYPKRKFRIERRQYDVLFAMQSENEDIPSWRARMDAMQRNMAEINRAIILPVNVDVYVKDLRLDLFQVITGNVAHRRHVDTLLGESGEELSRPEKIQFYMDRAVRNDAVADYYAARLSTLLDARRHGQTPSRLNRDDVRTVLSLFGQRVEAAHPCPDWANHDRQGHACRVDRAIDERLIQTIQELAQTEPRLAILETVVRAYSHSF